MPCLCKENEYNLQCCNTQNVTTTNDPNKYIVEHLLKEGANPAVANLNNKRFVLVQEPDDKHKVNCSTIKELNGDDNINVLDIVMMLEYILSTP